VCSLLLFTRPLPQRAHHPGVVTAQDMLDCWQCKQAHMRPGVLAAPVHRFIAGHIIVMLLIGHPHTSSTPPFSGDRCMYVQITPQPLTRVHQDNQDRFDNQVEQCARSELQALFGNEAISVAAAARGR
jgi:hypothetical protein